MAKVSAARVKRQIVAQIGDTALEKDLVNIYMSMREQALAGNASAATAMAAILDVLQVTPKSEKREKLEGEIRKQLLKKQLSGPVFEDKIHTFMCLWDAFQAAVRSLNERGRTYITISSAGKEYEKDNSAAGDIVKLAKSMTDILSDLGVTVKDYDSEDKDDPGDGSDW